MSIRLGDQVQRRKVSRHGHTRMEAVRDGETFKARFPSLVGQVLRIDRQGVDLAGKPEMIAAVEWLAANGYFLRG